MRTRVSVSVRILRTLALILAALYLLAAGLIYFGQERMIFHPRALGPDYVYEEGEELMVPTPDGVELSTVWLRKPDPKGVVLYFHGNVGDNRRSMYQLRDLLALPYDVVLWDYRGFGKSGGHVSSDAQLLADAEVVYATVAATYGEDRVHLLGYSLGTGMASHVAARNRPAQLVLVAPYTSLIAMKNQFFWWLPDFLLKYHLDTSDVIDEVTIPTTIFHGTDDELIPFSMAEQLETLAPEHVRLVPMPGVGHRGAILRVGSDWLN